RRRPPGQLSLILRPVPPARHCMETCMDFSLPPELEDYRLRVRRVVDEHLIPLESDRANFDEHENIADAALDNARAKVREAGLWALQMPRALGGQGLPMVGLAACYEEMNRSIFGPVAFNAAAPDDGNMRVLAQVARPDQKDRWLQPIRSEEHTSELQ